MSEQGLCKQTPRYLTGPQGLPRPKPLANEDNTLRIDKEPPPAREPRRPAKNKTQKEITENGHISKTMLR